MVRLELGAPRPARSPAEMIAEAERVNAILNNEDFGNLVTDTADRLIREWSRATTLDQREGCWHKLQGLQELLKQMQAAVDHATRLLRESDKGNLT